MYGLRNKAASAIAILAAMVATTALAAILSIPFFSQKDGRWSGQRLGTGNGTIGSHGCAVTSMAMILRYRGADVDPGKLNVWLTANQGYSNGDLIRWDKAGGYGNACWLGYAGAGSIKSLTDLNNQLAGRKLVIAKSRRYASHFVVIRGVTPDLRYGYYWDPADSAATQRRIGDGWVNVGAETRVFRY